MHDQRAMAWQAVKQANEFTAKNKMLKIPFGMQKLPIIPSVSIFYPIDPQGDRQCCRRRTEGVDSKILILRKSTVNIWGLMTWCVVQAVGNSF